MLRRATLIPSDGLLQVYLAHLLRASALTRKGGLLGCTVPELQVGGRDMERLAPRLEPDVTRQRLGVEDLLGVPLEHRTPVARQPRMLPGKRQRHPGPALTIG